MSNVNELVEVFFRRYLPRNEIVYRLPVGMTITEFWPEELAYRKQQAIELPLKSFDEHPYWFVMTKDFERAADHLAEITRTDMLKEMPAYTADESAVIDEAFFSSVIEGAYSTRQRAHEFISSGETPKDKNEQMILNIRNPDLSFPCKSLGELLECFEIQESGDIDLSSGNRGSHFFDFFDAFGLHWTYRGDGLNKIEPILILAIENYIRHFVVKRDFKAQIPQFVLSFDQIFLCRITDIQAFGIWSKARGEFLDDGFL